mmetsp:Transcript_9517/g.17892  ORF Transcript_9517/g.17892 Transcript_9517/m.17892 type:complete len:142 (-) Transcript_9517:1059-1484(-)
MSKYEHPEINLLNNLFHINKPSSICHVPPCSQSIDARIHSFIHIDTSKQTGIEINIKMDLNKEHEDYQEETTRGSWTATICIIIFLLVRWLFTSQREIALTFRRLFQMQLLQFKRKVGLRDDAKYKMGAGDGANQKHKRQG